MPRHTRSHRDLGGFVVADFADHDDVGVLPQDRAQPPREGQIGARIDLRLGDTVEFVFDRVLDRHDVARAVVEAGQRGVQRRGLARTRRPGDEQDAVGAFEQPREHRGVAVAHP